VFLVRFFKAPPTLIKFGFDHGNIRNVQGSDDILNKINIATSPELIGYFTVESYVYGYMSDYAASPQEKRSMLT
jgi:hypothetical protein